MVPILVVLLLSPPFAFLTCFSVHSLTDDRTKTHLASGVLTKAFSYHWWNFINSCPSPFMLVRLQVAFAPCNKYTYHVSNSCTSTTTPRKRLSLACNPNPWPTHPVPCPTSLCPSFWYCKIQKLACKTGCSSCTEEEVEEREKLREREREALKAIKALLWMASVEHHHTSSSPIHPPPRTACDYSCHLGRTQRFGDFWVKGLDSWGELLMITVFCKMGKGVEMGL